MIIQYQKFELSETLANEYEKRFDLATLSHANEPFVRRFKKTPKLETPSKFNILIEWEVHDIQYIVELKNDFNRFLSSFEPSVILQAS